MESSQRIHAKLSFLLHPTAKVVFSVNRRFTIELDITASNEWQKMTIPAKRLIGHGAGLSDWSVADSIGILPKRFDLTKVIFAEFKWVE